MKPADGDPVIRLFSYPASGNSYKVRLLLAQLEREYERVDVDIFGGDTLTDDFARINPARRTPVLQTATGRYLPESNAILLHLAEGTPYLPDDADARAQVYRWLFFEQAHFEPAVGSARFWRGTGREHREPARFAALQTAGVAALEIVESVLADRDFLAGPYSVADISLYAYGHVAHEAGIDMQAFPAIATWLQRVASTERFINDLAPYPESPMLGRGLSIHD